MDWITTTIKKKYLRPILRGVKTVEYKEASDYWRKRLHKHLGEHDGDLGINLLCGKEAYKFYVSKVKYRHYPDYEKKSIDGEYHNQFYEIYLGARLFKRFCSTCMDQVPHTVIIHSDLDLTNPLKHIRSSDILTCTACGHNQSG